MPPVNALLSNCKLTKAIICPIWVGMAPSWLFSVALKSVRAVNLPIVVGRGDRTKL